MPKLIRTFRDFSGGLAEVANDNMKDNELMEAVNVVPGDGYGISRCDGTEIAFSQGKPNTMCRRVIELQLQSGKQLIGFFCDGEHEYPYEWLGDWYPLVKNTNTTSTVNGDKLSTDTEITAADGTKYAEDDVIRDTTTKEIMLVVSVSENILTVERGHYGTTPAAIADGETLAVVENIVLDPIKSWFIYANKLYWLDGVKFQVWDGESLSYPTLTYEGSPSNELKTAFQARIDKAVAVTNRGSQWFYGSGSELIFSEIGDPLKFTVTNIINTPDGDDITAVSSFNEALLIWKKRSVHHLRGWDFANGTDIVLSQLNVTSGTEWPETISVIENGVLYLGTNGVYQLYVPYLSSLIAARNISDKKISNRITEGEITLATATVFNNVYYLSLRQNLPQSTQREYRYFVSDKSFYGEFTQGVCGYMPFLGGSNKLYIGSNNGYVLYYEPTSHHYINTNTGEETGIPIVAKTKGYDIVGNMFQDAKVKKIFISAKQYQADSTNLTVQIKADYADAAYSTDINSIEEVLINTTGMWGFEFDEALVYSEGEWGYDKWGWLETVSKEITIGKKCKRLQFIFAGNFAEPLLIYGMGIVFKKKKVKGNRGGVRAADIVYSED